MMAFKKKNRWNQRQRHFGGRWPPYQAPAQWVCVIWVNTALPGLGCCFGQGSGPSARNADRSAHLWWKQFSGTKGGESAVTVQRTVAARHLSEPQSCRFAQLLPLPRQTSARWQPLSPGSLQNSTTSRHVVSGVMGTSVTACSPSLRYTVNIIWERRIESGGLKGEQPHLVTAHAAEENHRTMFCRKENYWSWL